MSMLDDLRGARVLVTGASTGIGAAVAAAFARAGSKVVVHFNRSSEEANALAASIRADGGHVALVQGDLADGAGPAQVVASAASSLGGLDVLINNAGAMVKRAALEEIDEAIFDAVARLNVRSVVMTTKAAIHHLERAGGGAIINTTSVAARHGGGPGAGLYGAAKASVSSLTKNWAKEFAAKNIRVNAVSPGVIVTPFHDRYSTPDLLEAMRATVPSGRLGVPEDCVGAFLFLASKTMSGYVTGQTIEVNGGQYMI
jgi:3-oxoacyl-[acyl-carrier protein] reductase